MRKADLEEYDESVNYDDLETLKLSILYSMVSDDFYFSRITIHSCADTVLGEKFSKRYCANTLVKKLYEGKFIDEWAYVSYCNVKNKLKEFSKDKGFKDENELRRKLISMKYLINEFCDHLKSVEREHL